MLLGESAYSWLEDGEIVHPGEDHPTEIVDWIIRDFDEPNTSRARFLRGVTRMLCNSAAPSRAERSAAWNEVTFRNFISQSVGTGARVRPAPELWERARTEWRDTLAEQPPGM